MADLLSNRIATGITTAVAAIQRLRITRVLVTVLVSGILLIATAFYSDSAQAADNSSLGERFRDRMERADQRSERPKTTGEFLDEARGDVPLGERAENILRDSKEALGQFGKEYSVGAQESARNVKDKVTGSDRDFSNRVSH